MDTSRQIISKDVNEKDDQELTFEEVCSYMDRVRKFPEITLSMDVQAVKQINTAHAKMMNAVKTALENSSLTTEQRSKLESYVKYIDWRIRQAVEVQPGIDFKSCDSSGVTLGQQIARAEKKCQELPKQDDYDY